MAASSKITLTTRLDITPKNVLLRLIGIDAWSTERVYQQLGHPIREEVFLKNFDVSYGTVFDVYNKVKRS